VSEGASSIRLKTTVHHSQRGLALLDYLCLRFRYLPRGLWEERLATGRIRVNGEPPVPGAVVAAGDVIEYTIEIIEPPVDFSYDLIYEDDDLLVVSKSGNIPVHASGRYVRHTLVARVRKDRGERVNLAHRLDRETSGLVIFTRNRECARTVSAAFAEGRVSKTYVAVVRGNPSDDAFEIDAPLGRIGRRHPVPRSIIDRRGGKPARTLVRVVERLDGAAVVEVNPLTGRTNQVRAHLEYAGHPVVGDKTYGVPARLLRLVIENPDAPEAREHLLLSRHALHAARLALAHPRTGARLALEAPVPPDITSFIGSRRRDGRAPDPGVPLD
jgi:23S rRNA pseudouridine1911/1915/1917 synthase